MTSIFSTIGAGFKKLLGIESDPVDKVELSGKIELLDSTVSSVLAAYKTPAIRGFFPEALKPTASPEFKKIYDIYIRTGGSLVMSRERTGVLDSVCAALELIKTDLSDIASKLDMFGTSGSAEMTVTAFRVSDAALLGYYEQIFTLTRWAASMADIAINAASHIQTPPYKLDESLRDASRVGDFVRSLLNRRGTFVDGIKAMRAQGKDVALQTDGVTFDQYAKDTDYDAATASAVSGFFPSPFMMIGKRRIEKERAQIEALKATKNWLTAKIGLMQLDQARTDPSSPNYRRAAQTLAIYQRDLADTDKELASYV